jgi:hypothetical protein
MRSGWLYILIAALDTFLCRQHYKRHKGHAGTRHAKWASLAVFASVVCVQVYVCNPSNDTTRCFKPTMFLTRACVCVAKERSKPESAAHAHWRRQV